MVVTRSKGKNETSDDTSSTVSKSSDHHFFKDESETDKRRMINKTDLKKKGTIDVLIENRNKEDHTKKSKTISQSKGMTNNGDTLPPDILNNRKSKRTQIKENFVNKNHRVKDEEEGLSEESTIEELSNQETDDDVESDKNESDEDYYDESELKTAVKRKPSRSPNNQRKSERTTKKNHVQISSIAKNEKEFFATKPSHDALLNHSRGKRETSLNTFNFYNSLSNSKMSFKDIIQDWIKVYQKGPQLGLKTFVDLLLQCGGYNTLIESMTIEDDPVDILSNIQNSDPSLFNKEFMLTSKNKAMKTLCCQLFQFIPTFIFDIQHGVLFESLNEEHKFLDVLLSWCLAMSSCHYRPLRMSATMIGLLMNVGLCKVAASLKAQESQLLKLSKKKSTDDLIEGQLTLVHKWFEVIFNGIFIHRYRDVDPWIRNHCIRYLSEWISIYPEFYMENAYLRYIGWILSDKYVKPRLAALSGIRLLLTGVSADSEKFDLKNVRGNEERLMEMRSFLNRFTPRLIEIATRDKDVHCQIISSQILFILASFDCLEPEQYSTLFILLFTQNDKLRHTIGGLTKIFIDRNWIQNITFDSEEWKDCEILTPSFIVYKSIVLFIRSLKKDFKMNVFIGDFLIDALWSHFELENIKDWLDYILLDHSKFMQMLPKNTEHGWTLISNGAEEDILIILIQAVIKHKFKIETTKGRHRTSDSIKENANKIILGAWHQVYLKFRHNLKALKSVLSWTWSYLLPNSISNLNEGVGQFMMLLDDVMQYFIHFDQMNIATMDDSIVELFIEMLKILKTDQDQNAPFKIEKTNILKNIFDYLIITLRSSSSIGQGKDKKKLKNKNGLKDLLDETSEHYVTLMLLLYQIQAVVTVFDVRTLFESDYEEFKSLFQLVCEHVFNNEKGSEMEQKLALSKHLLNIQLKLLLWDIINLKSSSHSEKLEVSNETCEEIRNDANLFYERFNRVIIVKELKEFSKLERLNIFSDFYSLFTTSTFLTNDLRIKMNINLAKVLPNELSEHYFLVLENLYQRNYQTNKQLLDESLSNESMLESIIEKLEGLTDNKKKHEDRFLMNFEKFIKTGSVDPKDSKAIIKYYGVVDEKHQACLDILLDNVFGTLTTTTESFGLWIAESLKGSTHLISLSPMNQMKMSLEYKNGLSPLCHCIHSKLKNHPDGDKIIRTIFYQLITYLNHENNSIIFILALFVEIGWIALMSPTEAKKMIMYLNDNIEESKIKDKEEKATYMIVKKALEKQSKIHRNSTRNALEEKTTTPQTFSPIKEMTESKSSSSNMTDLKNSTSSNQSNISNESNVSNELSIHENVITTMGSNSDDEEGLDGQTPIQDHQEKDQFWEEMNSYHGLSENNHLQSEVSPQRPARKDNPSVQGRTIMTQGPEKGSNLSFEPVPILNDKKKRDRRRGIRNDDDNNNSTSKARPFQASDDDKENILIQNTKRKVPERKPDKYNKMKMEAKDQLQLPSSPLI